MLVLRFVLSFVCGLLAPEFFGNPASFHVVNSHIYPVEVRPQGSKISSVVPSQSQLSKYTYNKVKLSTFPVLPHYFEATSRYVSAKCQAREIVLPSPHRPYSHEVLCQYPTGRWISHGYVNHKVTQILISKCGVIAVQDASGLTSCTVLSRVELQPCSFISGIALHNDVSLTQDGIVSFVRQIQFPNGELAQEIYRRDLKAEQQGARLAFLQGGLKITQFATTVCVLLVSQDIYCRGSSEIDQWMEVPFHVKYNSEIYSKILWTSITVYGDTFITVEGVHRVTFADITAGTPHWPSIPLQLKGDEKGFTTLKRMARKPLLVPSKHFLFD
jgi:hypothetical protein